MHGDTKSSSHLTMKGDLMKFKHLLLTSITALLSAAQLANANDFDLVDRPLRPIRPPIYSCGIDPAAAKIDFAIVSRTTQFRGRVRVTATVKNVGRRDFISRVGQQTALLYSDSTLVARRDFVNLAVGQAFTFSYERQWDSSSPAEGEFPPNYRVVLTYDPDIYIDGNTQNDDCSNANNNRVRSGAGINDLFRL